MIQDQGVCDDGDVVIMIGDLHLELSDVLMPASPHKNRASLHRLVRTAAESLVIIILIRPAPSASEGAAFHLQIKINLFQLALLLIREFLQLFKNPPSRSSPRYHLFPLVLITIMLADNTRTLPTDLFTELTAAIRGDVYLPTDPKYVMDRALHFSLFHFL